MITIFSTIFVNYFAWKWFSLWFWCSSRPSPFACPQSPAARFSPFGMYAAFSFSRFVGCGWLQIIYKIQSENETLFKGEEKNKSRRKKECNRFVLMGLEGI